MKLSKATIKEIAEKLDCGFICYIHKETKEILSISDFDNHYVEEEFWEEELNEIENNWDKYTKIEKMSSREAFQIMEDFTKQVSNKEIEKRLRYALGRSKPFQHFKHEVDYNEEVRQHWFKYKAYRYEEWVIEYLKRETDAPEYEKEMPKIMGYYDDDGNALNPDLHPLPNLCLSCKKKDDPSEEMVCNLNRLGQLGEIEFICHSYEKIGKK